MIAAIEPYLPLVIDRVSFEYGTNLLIGGESWSLSVTAPWRITRDGTLLVGSDDQGLTLPLIDLDTQRIRDVVPQGVGGLDLAFKLDDGKALEVFSCHPVEPWILRLPSGPVWVSSPSEPGVM